MSDAHLELDLSKCPVYESGALLIALLVLPDGDEVARRSLMATLCQFALSAQFDLKSAESWKEQPIKPAYAFRSETEMRRDTRTLHRRWRDRILAARMASPLVTKGLINELPRLPVEIKKLSLNELSNLVEWELGNL
jgi:hypothetical protein